MDDNDKIIYNLIQESKSIGCTKADLKHKSGLNNTLVNSSLKKLEKKLDLVQSLKAKDKNRLVYLLAEIDADDQITGGNLYEKGEIDHNLINQIFRKIQEFLANKGMSNLEEINNHLAANKTNDKDLSMSDVKTLVNILILEDKVEMIPGGFSKPSYQLSANDRAFRNDILTKLPCGTCPVFDECKIGGNISPENCIYLSDW